MNVHVCDRCTCACNQGLSLHGVDHNFVHSSNECSRDGDTLCTISTRIGKGSGEAARHGYKRFLRSKVSGPIREVRGSLRWMVALSTKHLQAQSVRTAGLPGSAIHRNSGKLLPFAVCQHITVLAGVHSACTESSDAGIMTDSLHSHDSGSKLPPALLAKLMPVQPMSQ
jgi:hypothetical protein